LRWGESGVLMDALFGRPEPLLERSALTDSHPLANSVTGC
jgi:hypothetical protein